jgi:type I restriction-modification system DNA methylase subunit
MTTKEEVLKKCTIEGNVIKLPNVELDRKLYKEVASSIVKIGGKWKGGKVFGFVFLTDPTDLLNQISNGEKRNLKKEFQFFGTPDEYCDKLVVLADIKPDDSICEPSAGQGAIIKAINKVTDTIPDCFELMENNRIVLKNSGLKFNLISDDFLKYKGNKYDKIIANPPFSKNQDIDHIKAMYQSLKNGGRLVSISSDMWYSGTQKKQIEFKNWLFELNAVIIEIPKGAFKESGTMVGGIIIVINKPK